MDLSATTIGLLTASLAFALPLLMGLFRSKRKLAGQHVVITGGSKGIGLAVAEEFVRRGCHVTIIARKQADLDSALQQLTALAKSLGVASCKLQALSADTTNPEQIKGALNKATQVAGPINVLVCNAGFSSPGRFVDLDLATIERQMQVNYLGTVNTIKCALPAMLERGQGHIAIIASTLAVLGFAGYSAYAPSKWALRGLADCMRNELSGTGVSVSVGYPPDTDTPGYAEENEVKPEICTKVNDALGSALFSASKVASCLVRGIQRGDYHLPSPDFGQVLLVDSMAGISPKALPSPLGCLLAPITYLVTAFLRGRADAAARACNRSAAAADRKK